MQSAACDQRHILWVALKLVQAIPNSWHVSGSQRRTSRKIARSSWQTSLSTRPYPHHRRLITRTI